MSPQTSTRQAQTDPYDPDFVPPHLRKVKAAKAFKANGEEGNAKEEGARDAVPAKLHEDPFPSKTNKSGITRVEDGASPEHQSDTRTVDKLPSVEAIGMSQKPITEHQSSTVGIGNYSLLRRFPQGFRNSCHAPPKTPPRSLSFEALLNMAANECADRLSAVAERRSDVIEAVEVNHEEVLNHEDAPPLTRPAKHSMSIDMLKSLRNYSVPQAIDDRIEDANHVISGKPNTVNGSRRIHARSMKVSQLLDDRQNLGNGSHAALSTAAQDEKWLSKDDTSDRGTQNGEHDGEQEPNVCEVEANI